MSRDQEARTVALDRRVGMHPDTKDILTEEFAKWNDWYATCPRCHTKLTGTLASLREHKCGSKGK